MVFNSFQFICIFLPIAIAGWYLLNRRSMILADWFLIAMSLWFYGSFGVWYLVILAASTLFNYGMGWALNRKAQAAEGSRKVLLTVGILVNLAFLCLFKYVSPALAEQVTAGTLGVSEAMESFLAIGLPVGFSFYTFSQLSYLIDSYRRELLRDGFRRYLLYITYFPKIIEGPITCYEEIASQLRTPEKRRFRAEGFARGLILFVLGLGKKLLIADVLAGAANFGIQSAYYLDTLAGILTMCCYALQLYYDFSGYCDMAMGISAMLGIDLPLNFNAPFQAESFPEFWKRWHMTLTRFFTRYVYIPLGGSRKGKIRTCLNVMVVFLLSAFWHGLGGTYLVWGLLSGLLVVAGNLAAGREHKPGRSTEGVKASVRPMNGMNENREKTAGEESAPAAGKRRLCTGMRRLGVFALFLFTLVFFGAPNLEYSGAIFRRLLVPMYPGWLYRMAAKLDVPEFWVINKVVAAVAPSLSNPVLLLELLVIVAAALVFTQKRTAAELSQTMQLSGRNAFLIGVLLILCLCSMSGVSTYLYFKF